MSVDINYATPQSNLWYRTTRYSNQLFYKRRDYPLHQLSFEVFSSATIDKKGTVSTPKKAIHYLLQFIQKTQDDMNA